MDAGYCDGGTEVVLDMAGRIVLVEDFDSSFEFIHDDLARLKIGSLSFVVGIAHGTLTSPILTVLPEPAIPTEGVQSRP